MTAPDPAQAVHALLDAAEQAYAIDDLGRARGCYQDVLAVSPGHPLASRALVELDRQLSEAFTGEAVVALTVELGELVRRALPASEAFSLSRIAAGPMTVADLEKASGIDRVKLRAMLQGWERQGLVSIC